MQLPQKIEAFSRLLFLDGCGSSGGRSMEPGTARNARRWADRRLFYPSAGLSGRLVLQKLPDPCPLIGSQAEQYSELGLAYERKAVTMAIKANTLDAVIFTGNASLDPANEYRASDDPEQPKAYLLDPQIPQGATPICAWFTPLESVDGLTGFATISVELLIGVDTPTGVGVWLGLVRRQTDDKRMKIRIYALYDENVPPTPSQETVEASAPKAAQ